MTGGSTPFFELISAPTNTKHVPTMVNPTINELRGKRNGKIQFDPPQRMLPNPRTDANPVTSEQPGIESSTGTPKAERPRGTALKAKRVTQQGSDKTSRPESIKMINPPEQNRPNEGRTVAGSICSDPAGRPQFIRDSFGRGPTDPAKRSFTHSELTDSPKDDWDDSKQK